MIYINITNKKPLIRLFLITHETRVINTFRMLELLLSFHLVSDSRAN